MKKLLLGVWIGVWMCLGISSSFAEDGKIGGTYAVQGTNPGGKVSYTGTVTITPTGKVYQMDWKVGNTYSGIGIVNGNILSVGWGNLAQAGYGVVTYTIQSNGVLSGTWAMAKGTELGTETLTPMK